MTLSTAELLTRMETTLQTDIDHLTIEIANLEDALKDAKQSLAEALEELAKVRAQKATEGRA